MVFHTQFRFRPDDWRVWFDEVIGLWRACRWDRNGGVVSAKKIEANNVGFRCEDGKYMRFPNCEVKISLESYISDEHVVCEVFRICPPSQTVAVPLMSAGASSKDPE